MVQHRRVYRLVVIALLPLDYSARAFEADEAFHGMPFQQAHRDVKIAAPKLAVAFRNLADGFDANARLIFGLALTAILVHSLFYNALFEDPTFWALLALAVVASRAGTASAESPA